MTGSNRVRSFTFPPATVNAKGRPRPSRARWILVPSPPQERPSASPVLDPRYRLRGLAMRLPAFGPGMT